MRIVHKKLKLAIFLQNHTMRLAHLDWAGSIESAFRCFLWTNDALLEIFAQRDMTEEKNSEFLFPARLHGV